MPADVSFAANASLDFKTCDTLTDSDDYSSVSDDIHIGFSPRPQLPPVLSANSLSNRVPPKLAADTTSRDPRPSCRAVCSSSEYPRARHLSSLSPIPHSASPTRSAQGIPPRDSDTGRRYSNSTEPHNGCDDRRYDGDCSNSLSSPLHNRGRKYLTGTNHDANHARRLTEHSVISRHQLRGFLTNFNKAQSQRAHVRRLWQIKDEADRQFMAAAQALTCNNSQSHQLHQLFNAMQATRLGYEAAEKRLEEIFTTLQHGKIDLDSDEEYTDVPEKAPVQATHGNSYTPNGDNMSLCGITGDRPENTHPLYDKLLKVFAELQLARELLVNTQIKREVFRAQKSQPLAEASLDLLEKYGDVGRRKAIELRTMALTTEDDHEQMQEYDELEQTAKHDIQLYAERARLLEQECEKNGVLPPSAYFNLEAFALGSFHRDEIHLTPVSSDTNNESVTLAHPVFPLLLSNPAYLLHDFPQTALQSLRIAVELPLDSPERERKVSEAAREANMDTILSIVESDDKNEFINRWLLHKLHHSAMEAELLWATFRTRLEILDIDRWQRHVLYFWWRDDSVDAVPVGIGSSVTDKTADLNDRGAEFKTFAYSDSGQLDGLRRWHLDDTWL